MPIKPLNNHYAMEALSSVYDEEAMTALQLAGKTTRKVNELVEAFNDLEESVPVQIADDVNAHIENGDFDEAIDEYAGDLKSKVDHLFANVPVGSTTMDAEVIDGRRGAEGEIFTAIGDAIRNQILRTLRVVTHTMTDADKMVDAGIYYKGVEAWEHVPETMTNTAGFIVTIAPNNTPYRILQMAIDWNGIVSTRRKRDADNFTPWVSLALSSRVEAMKPLEYKVTNVAQTWNADTMTETGLYFLGDAHTKKNVPTDNGLLIVYKGPQDHNIYQMWWDYWGSGLYTRNFNASTNSFRAWSPVANKATATVSGSSFPYTVQKVNDDLFYIFKKGSSGYIRYGIAHDVNTTTNLDTYRLQTIDHVNSNKVRINSISNEGADVEGVILTTLSVDHVGGVHGSERATSYAIFIDGKPYTMGSIPSMECSEIRVVVESRLYNPNLPDESIFGHRKQLVFDRGGVHVHNWWLPDIAISVTSVRAGMMSVDKANITHYMDEGLGVIPLAEVPADSGAIKRLFYSPLGDVGLGGAPEDIALVYLGNISVKHWCEMNGSSKELFIEDYQTRLKSYYTSWNNTEVGPVDFITATNHIQIEC